VALRSGRRDPRGRRPTADAPGRRPRPARDDDLARRRPRESADRSACLRTAAGGRLLPTGPHRCGRGRSLLDRRGFAARSQSVSRNSTPAHEPARIRWPRHLSRESGPADRTGPRGLSAPLDRRRGRDPRAGRRGARRRRRLRCLRRRARSRARRRGALRARPGTDRTRRSRGWTRRPARRDDQSLDRGARPIEHVVRVLPIPQ